MQKHACIRTRMHTVGPPDPWSTDDLASASMMLETVSKLIEIVPVKKGRELQAPRGTTPRGSTPHHVTFRPNSQLEVDISREGMWLLSHYCTPTTTVRVSACGRIWL